jgi:hypothetical protein
MGPGGGASASGQHPAGAADGLGIERRRHEQNQPVHAHAVEQLAGARVGLQPALVHAREHRDEERRGLASGSLVLVARQPHQVAQPGMQGLRVEAVGVAAGDGGHPRAEAADDNGWWRIGSQEPVLAGPQPAHEGDGVDHLLGARRVALDRPPQDLLFDRVRRLAAAAGAQPQEQAPAGDGLQRRRHVGQQSRMAVGHVEHQRAQGNAPGGFGECRQHRPRLRYARALGGVGIAQVIPGPQAIEAGLFGRARRRPHVGIARAHRDQEQIRLHWPASRRRGSTSLAKRLRPFSASACVMKPERLARIRCSNRPAFYWKSMICR